VHQEGEKPVLDRLIHRCHIMAIKGEFQYATRRHRTA
jgi:hypothetical protein